MMRSLKVLLLASFIACLVASCGGKGKGTSKTDAKGQDTRAESKADPKAESKAPPKAEPAPGTDAAPPAPVPVTAPATPPPPPTQTPMPVLTDTAIPPDTTTPPKPEDKLLDPDKAKYGDYVIKTKTGGQFTVKWYWKEKGKITFQAAGGDIALKVDEILTIEGRAKED